MKKNILIFSILAASVVSSAIIINTASAQGDTTATVPPPASTLSNLTYPIPELGNCKDQTDCKTYCDDATHTASCVSFAEKKNLMSKDEIQTARKFIATGAKGPGGCNGKKECQAYCEDKAHIDECVSYAEKNGLMSTQDLQKAKKVQTAIQKGVKFPACKNKTECDKYCEDPAHMQECITFAKDAGLLSAQELQNSDKVLTAIQQGVKPPPCKGKDACDLYCADASHATECVNFAVSAGIVTADQARIIKETGGIGPGGCKNKNECDVFCGNADNRDTCMAFAKEHNIPQPQPPQGQMNQEGKGPGNGAGQGKGGPGEGFGPGNGAGQGGGQGDIQKIIINVNPSKCIAECESAGKNCISALGEETKACNSAGQDCRQITCSNINGAGNQVTAEEFHACNDTKCTPEETRCHAVVTAKDSACRTTKDVCVMNCQKASKQTKPTQPPQPNQASGQAPGTYPMRPPQPTEPGGQVPTISPNQPQPTEPGGQVPGMYPTRPPQPPQPTQPMQPPESTQSGGQVPGIYPAQPMPPTQPTAPTGGYCGDGKCGKMEQANPSLCPQDCGGATNTTSGTAL